MQDQQEQPQPYQLNYVSFDLKPSRKHFLNQKLSQEENGGDAHYQELMQAIYRVERLDEREAKVHFKKAIALNPHHFFTWFLMGEMLQCNQKSQSIECFEKAKQCIAEYAHMQEYPRSQSYDELSENDRSIYTQQLILLCDALILDTKGCSIDANRLYQMGIELREKGVDGRESNIADPAREVVVARQIGEHDDDDNDHVDNDDDNDDDDDDEHPPPLPVCLQWNNLNEQVERIMNEEDDFIMSFLYLYWNYSLQRSLWSPEAMVVACMKSLAYGVPYSPILPLWDIFRFLCTIEVESNKIQCAQKNQFYQDALNVDELRCLQGARFYFGDMLASDNETQTSQAVQIAEYFFERHKNIPVVNLFYALSLQHQGKTELFQQYLRKAFEMQPCYYMLEQMYDMTDLDADREEYMEQTERLIDLAKQYITMDYEVTESVIEIRFWQRMFQTSRRIETVYFETGDIDLVKQLQWEWNVSWDKYRQKKDLESFLHYPEEQLFKPESRFSTQQKQALYYRTQQLADVEIITQQ